MKIRHAIAALAFVAASPAYAQDTVAELAEATGLSERKVQMIVGNRTPFAEYRHSYDRSLAQFRAALGEDQYRRFVAGLPVDLDAVARARATALDGRGTVANHL